MVDCFRKEEPASVTGGRLIIDPSEKVFVQEVEQSEGCKREAIDDRGYDGKAERDYNQLSRCGEESTPFRCARRVLNLAHRAWGGSKESHFDKIRNEGPSLQKCFARSRKAL
jgi:hypothetical protein